MERYSRVRAGKWQSQYSEKFKLSVIEEYLNGNISARSLEKKHKIGNSRLTFWLKEFGFQLKRAYFPVVKKEEITKPNPIINEHTTDATLQKQLEDALLLAEGYKRMIEIAENELKIPIRKKYNTK